MTINERVKNRAKELGLTVEEVERQCGLGKRTIYYWDVNSPSIDKVKRVADLLDTSPAYIMGWDDEISEKNALLEELLRNEDSRALMDAADGCTPEQIRAVVEMMKVWKRTSY